jgi:hypothetical protein
MQYDGSVVRQAFAYHSSYRIGLDVAAGDVDGDGEVEVILAPCQGGGPHIQVIGAGGVEDQFMAYIETFRGGIDLEVADLNGDGTAEIVTVPMGDGGPHLRVFNAEGGVLNQLMSHHPAFRGGINLSLAE